MKVIELLTKIANGEEVPKKIKWGEFELEWEELGYHDYKFLGTGNHLLFQGFATSVLNDEVKIIEENIRKLPNEVREPHNFEEVVYIAEDLVNKINEIIDKINEME